MPEDLDAIRAARQARIDAETDALLAQFPKSRPVFAPRPEIVKAEQKLFGLIKELDVDERNAILRHVAARAFALVKSEKRSAATAARNVARNRRPITDAQRTALSQAQQARRAREKAERESSG